MYRLTQDSFVNLLEFRHDPCLTFYLPIQPADQASRQHMVTATIKNQIREASDILLERGIRQSQIDLMTKPLKDLFDSSWFTKPLPSGLAVFISEDLFQIIQLPRIVSESVTVSNRFHVRPLLSFQNDSGTYYLLALSLRSLTLYKADYDQLMPVAMPDLPESLQTIIDSYSMESNLQRHSSSSKGSNRANSSIQHGYENAKDSEKDRIIEYFRSIDDVLNKHLAADIKPLVLVCVDYLYPLYQSISRYPRLLEQHVSGSPDTLGAERLASEGWQIAAPEFVTGQQKAWAKCEQKMGTPQVRTNARSIVKAAVQGQIEALFLLPESPPAVSPVLSSDADEQIIEPGRSEIDDLLDIAILQVLRHNGKVYLLDPADLPDNADCLALLRYA